jgi:soluble lytic murein transglycosylase-like protein
MWSSRLAWLPAVLSGVALAQTIPFSARESAERARAAMADSLNLQRQSVTLQLRTHRVMESFDRAVAPVRVPRLTFPSASLHWWPARTGGCAAITPASLNPLIENAAEEQSLSANLLHAVVATESAYVPCAVSPKGALGLMQLMPATAQTLGVTDPMDPKQSIGAGAKYLSQLLARYGGDLRLALSAYNAGPGHVDKYGEVPPFPETQRYVHKILSLPGIRLLEPSPSFR